MRLTLILAILLCGCAHKQIKSEPISQPVETKAIEEPVQEGTIPTTPVTLDHHIVKKGESLWLISGAYYGDPFQWPIIFMDNRDQIKDEDIIEVGQNLNIERSNPPEAVSEAHKIASREPAYHPHKRKASKI